MQAIYTALGTLFSNKTDQKKQVKQTDHVEINRYVLVLVSVCLNHFSWWLQLFPKSVIFI